MIELFAAVGIAITVIATNVAFAMFTSWLESDDMFGSFAISLVDGLLITLLIAKYVLQMW